MKNLKILFLMVITSLMFACKSTDSVIDGKYVEHLEEELALTKADLALADSIYNASYSASKEIVDAYEQTLILAREKTQQNYQKCLQTKTQCECVGHIYAIYRYNGITEFILQLKYGEIPQ